MWEVKMYIKGNNVLNLFQQKNDQRYIHRQQLILQIHRYTYVRRSYHLLVVR